MIADAWQISTGEALALMTAVTWAIAVIFFKKSGETADPIGLNLFKDLLAVVLLIPTIWLFGETLFFPASWQDYLIIFLSGALGIGVSDSLFFKSLNILGAGLSAIVDCLYSPFVIVLSMLFLGESLTLLQFIGALMIISAVLTAVTETQAKVTDRMTIIKGSIYGALAQALTAGGVVMVKPVLERSPLLWVTEMRLLAGSLFLLGLLALHPARKRIVKSVFTRIGFGYTFFGSLAGGYIAMALWLGGMKFTQASTASVLNQTSSIFIFILAAMFLKEKVTFLRLIGILVGVGGALLVTLG